MSLEGTEPPVAAASRRTPPTTRRGAGPVRPKALLSFDVEEFDLPGEYGNLPPLAEQIEVGTRGLTAVLELLDRTGVRATFFTTAVFAQARPEMLRRIAASPLRHEVASHGWSHSSFEEKDLLRSRLALEEIVGKPVVGFRRARFGAFDRAALALAGYRYDSSDNPIWLPGRYNNLKEPRTPYRFVAGEGSRPVTILPVSASPLVRYPLFWLSFKHSPMALYRLASRWSLAKDEYLNFFFHPWEFASLAGYKIPFVVRRRAGEEMVARLEEYLLWLRERADFETLADFAVRWENQQALSLFNKS